MYYKKWNTIKFICEKNKPMKTELRKLLFDSQAKHINVFLYLYSNCSGLIQLMFVCL